MTQWNSKYFKRAEFACKCGCGMDTVDYELVNILDKVREHFGTPVVINSACRCEAHNASVGGAANSMHVQSRAADIVVHGVPASEVHAYIDQHCDVGGLGKYDTFTHVDTRGYRARWGGS